MRIEFEKTVESRGNTSLSQVNDVVLTKYGVRVKIAFAQNGDLFMTIDGGNGYRNIRGNMEKSFTVEENDEVYPLFEKLYENIINGNVNRSRNELGEAWTSRAQERLKRSYEYHDLINSRREIVWLSDDRPRNFANALIVSRGENGIMMRFASSTSFVENATTRRSDYVVHFANSGSRYEPFNLCFWGLFQDLQRLNQQTSAEECE